MILLLFMQWPPWNMDNIPQSHVFFNTIQSQSKFIIRQFWSSFNHIRSVLWLDIDVQTIVKKMNIPLKPTKTRISLFTYSSSSMIFSTCFMISGARKDRRTRWCSWSNWTTWNSIWRVSKNDQRMQDTSSPHFIPSSTRSFPPRYTLINCKIPWICTRRRIEKPNCTKEYNILLPFHSQCTFEELHQSINPWLQWILYNIFDINDKEKWQKRMKLFLTVWKEWWFFFGTLLKEKINHLFADI